MTVFEVTAASASSSALTLWGISSRGTMSPLPRGRPGLPARPGPACRAALYAATTCRGQCSTPLTLTKCGLILGSDL